MFWTYRKTGVISYEQKIDRSKSTIILSYFSINLLFNPFGHGVLGLNINVCKRCFPCNVFPLQNITQFTLSNFHNEKYHNLICISFFPHDSFTDSFIKFFQQLQVEPEYFPENRIVREYLEDLT